MLPAEAKTIRERTGLTTAQVADRIGVTVGRVWQLEAPARRTPLPESAAAVLDAIAATFDAAVRAGVLRARRLRHVPRYATPAEFDAAVPALAGWGNGTHAAYVAAIATILPDLPVEFDRAEGEA